MELNLSGVHKSAAKILTVQVAQYIEYFRKAKGCDPESIALSAKQWDRLEAELKKENRNLDGCTFRGITLRRCES